MGQWCFPTECISRCILGDRMCCLVDAPHATLCVDGASTPVPSRTCPWDSLPCGSFESRHCDEPIDSCDGNDGGGVDSEYRVRRIVVCRSCVWKIVKMTILPNLPVPFWNHCNHESFCCCLLFCPCSSSSFPSGYRGLRSVVSPFSISHAAAAALAAAAVAV